MTALSLPGGPAHFARTEKAKSGRNVLQTQLSADSLPRTRGEFLKKIYTSHNRPPNCLSLWETANKEPPKRCKPDTYRKTFLTTRLNGENLSFVVWPLSIKSIPAFSSIFKSRLGRWYIKIVKTSCEKLIFLSSSINLFNIFLIINSNQLNILARTSNYRRRIVTPSEANRSRILSRSS